MAKVFLDANIVIDLVERKKESSVAVLALHTLLISPLSLHILAYVYKYSCPSEILQAAVEAFSLVPIDSTVIARASLGPTIDFEDNIQLHSASAAECDYFLTSDQRLLKLGFFGNTRITDQLKLK